MKVRGWTTFIRVRALNVVMRADYLEWSIDTLLSPYNRSASCNGNCPIETSCKQFNIQKILILQITVATIIITVVSIIEPIRGYCHNRYDPLTPSTDQGVLFLQRYLLVSRSETKENQCICIPFLPQRLYCWRNHLVNVLPLSTSTIVCEPRVLVCIVTSALLRGPVGRDPSMWRRLWAKIW